ncbi:PqqD family peptide modification chaperone [Tistrella mobilis]|uniref:PqqD family protein n=1 Tax=Tistrella mobilis TaxID=171437 RepID=A0A162K4F3_9PROT|nr:PqqD family peptide modification chaperone [Tistrella mobilis]KYO50464.1 hypothetical protein AUP44_12625 [Tistrella mobilis]
MTEILRRADDVSAVTGDGETLLLNLSTGLWHGLDPIAARIWEMLAEPMDADGLVARLVAEYEVTPETCRAEIIPLLDRMRARGLLAGG